MAGDRRSSTTSRWRLAGCPNRRCRHRRSLSGLETAPVDLFEDSTCQFKKANSTLAELGLSDPRNRDVEGTSGWDGLAGRSIEVAPAVEGLGLHRWDTRMGPRPS